MPCQLVVALDTPDPRQAAAWADAVTPCCGLLKLGLEFFAANGPAGVRAVTDRPVFLDLKLHDIPNTVAGAVRSLLPLRPRMLTLHAGGGARMIAAARDACRDAPDPPLLLGVTVLTSLDGDALAALGVPSGVEEQVVRLARIAVASGAQGLVCSPREVRAIRQALGPEPVLVVPGVRPAGSAPDDQARPMTPREAAGAGADWIVVGRPIIGAADPGAAAHDIAASIAG